MKKIVILISIISIWSSVSNFTFSQAESSPEMNVVYGKKHIFTVETPEKWINDKESAKKIGLVCFFYAKVDASLQPKSYIYANGIDKASSDETLEDFIKGDLEIYKKKYPNLLYENVDVTFTGGIKNRKMYTFSNLHDRFVEEVCYAETDASILIFVFSAQTADDFVKYRPVFDQFMRSFNYRGDNPQPFLDYLNSKKN